MKTEAKVTEPFIFLIKNPISRNTDLEDYPQIEEAVPDFKKDYQNLNVSTGLGTDGHKKAN